MNLPYVLLLLFATGSLSYAGKNPHKEYMLKKNKVPKQIDLSQILVRGRGGQIEPLNMKQKSDICDECKETAGKIEEILSNKAKLDELKALLRIACSYAGDYREECNEIVDNLDTIAEELKPLFADPEAFCEEIHLCGSDRVSQYHRLALVYFKKYTQKLAGYSNDLVCEECEFAMTELKTLLDDKDMQDEIKEGLHELCSVLGGETAQECDNLVDEYFPQLIQELEQLLSDPKALCEMLGLCEQTKMALQSLLLMPAQRRGTQRLTPANELPVIRPVRLESFMRMLRTLQTSNGNGVSCILCETGLSGLVNYLKDDAALQQKVADAIQNVACNKVLPADFKDGCNDFVGLYLKSVLYMTLETIDVEKICDFIKACSTYDLRALQMATPQMKSELLCESCTVAMEYLKTELADTTFQTEVAAELEKVCTMLPQEYQQQCVSFMEFYVPQVMAMLQDQLNPQEACTEMQLCP